MNNCLILKIVCFWSTMNTCFLRKKSEKSIKISKCKLRSCREVVKLYKLCRLVSSFNVMRLVFIMDLVTRIGFILRRRPVTCPRPSPPELDGNQNLGWRLHLTQFSSNLCTRPFFPNWCGKRGWQIHNFTALEPKIHGKLFKEKYFV